MNDMKYITAGTEIYIEQHVLYKHSKILDFSLGNII